MSVLPWLDPYDDTEPFPDPQLALDDPDGLLAVGGNLSPQRLLNAYQQGIFPWYSDDQPILWWSPDPRTVLFPKSIKIRRSLRKILRRKDFSLTADTVFSSVMRGCSGPRNSESHSETSTWITPEMYAAYFRLHRLGYAHSIECWHGHRLVGGLYGIALGKVFYGESMFSFMSNASKVALVALCLQLQRWQFTLIDCQMETPHLLNMGAELISRAKFTQLLKQYCTINDSAQHWQLDDDLMQPFEV